jgi:hypothetical protein
MASVIKIKRSGNTASPATLGAGELAYSWFNGTNKLYLGTGTETAGAAANIDVIGGKYFTDMLDHTLGTLTANSAVLVDANSKIDVFNVDNLRLDGNAITSTDTNGDISITPNGTGKTIITNIYTDASTTLQEFIYDTVGGAVTGGTGITVTNSDGDNTSTISITNTGVTAGTYGSASAIPVLAINAQGQITTASTVDVATTLNIQGNSGTDGIALLTETLTVTGTAPINAAVTANTITISAADATTSAKGVASFSDASFAVASGVVTIKAAGVSNNQLANSSVTIGSTTVSLGSTSTTLAGVTQLDVDNIRVDGNTVSATNTDGNVILAPNGTGTVDVSSKRITSVADPTQAQDAATKSYVDAVKTGLDIKDSVRVATTANINLTNTQTIDAVALAVGDRVLVKNQTTGSQNGIYVVASGAWTRATDFDADVEVTGGAFTFVEEGTVNADSGWVLTTNNTITIGTTALTFAQFSGAGQITAGAGLTKTGNTIDAVGTADRITVNSDSIDIASTYVGQTSITTLGTIATGTWQGSIVAGQYGGTGVNNSGKTITLGGNLTTSGAFTTTLTVTAATSVTLPTTGTLATLAGTEALSNKTITDSSFSGTTVAATGQISTTLTTDSSSTTTGSIVTAGGMGIAKKLYVGDDIIGSGAATSLLDGFEIDGGTY